MNTYGGCAIGGGVGNYKLWVLRELKSARGVIGVSEETGWTTIALVFAPKPSEGGGRFTAEGGVGVSEGPGGQAAFQGGDGACLVFPPPPPVMVFNGILWTPVSPLPG